MEVFAGFLFGFLGSVHCAGMCGPIALSLPSTLSQSSQPKKEQLLKAQLLYNSGRVCTYMLMGGTIGLLGWSVHLAGIQRYVSLATGFIMLAFVIFPSSKKIQQYIYPLLSKFIKKIKEYWPQMQEKKSFRTFFTIGLVNGLLPCGFLYIALAAALATGHPVKAILFMALFGLGTTPMMAGIIHCGQICQLQLRNKVRWLFPAATTLLAMLFILRGMSLGIPYISPELTAGSHACCH